MNSGGTEKRRYIRHPSDIPIQVNLRSGASDGGKLLNNISFGGLCFKSAKPFRKGDTVRVRIDHVRPVFEAEARIVWCAEKEAGMYDVGVEFSEEGGAFRARMVEQVCRIESYKREISAKEGRNLTGAEAALEWINKYAEKFPK